MTRRELLKTKAAPEKIPKRAHEKSGTNMPTEIGDEEGNTQRSGKKCQLIMGVWWIEGGARRGPTLGGGRSKKTRSL